MWFVPKLIWPFKQNAVPIISEFVVTNDTEKTFEELTLQVESDHQFASTRIWTLDRLQPGTRFHVTDVKIDVSHAFLADLKEAVRGSLTFTLKQGDTVFDIQREEVGVLAKVVAIVPSFEGLLVEAFDQIRGSAEVNVAILARIERRLSEVRETLETRSALCAGEVKG